MSGCPNACVDGWVTTFDADGTERVRACAPCQQAGPTEFKAGYRPAGAVTPLWARKVRIPPKTYVAAPGLSDEQLEQRYRRMLTLSGQYSRPGATRYAFERGRDTVLAIHRVHRRRLLAAGGERYRTTNNEIAAALERDGRPRSRRTIQRHHGSSKRGTKTLAVEWIRKSGAARRPGELDCLEIRFTRGCVTPPLRGATRAGFKAGRPANHVQKALLAPTSSAERAPPDGGNGQGSDEGGGEATTEIVGGPSGP